MVSGELGGFWGLPGLLIELPVSTVLMLRAIAAAARKEGEDLETAEARWACLEVFTLGGAGSMLLIKGIDFSTFKNLGKFPNIDTKVV